MPGHKKYFWLQLRGSKTLKSSLRSSSHKSYQLKSLPRMTDRSIDDKLDGTLSASPSEQDFFELLSKAQCRRYESQRSPYPSPAIIRATPDLPESGDDDQEDKDSVDAFTNVRQTNLEHFEASLNSSGGSSGDDNSLSPAHNLLPLGSPSLRPNRRSVEALKKLIQSNDDVPFPLIITPPDGGYWVQNGEYETSRGEDGMWHAPEIDTEHFRLETNTTALMYGRHFVGRPHKNFYVQDNKLGPLVFSLMIDSDVNCDPLIRMILRTKNETYYKVYPSAQLSRKLEPEEYLAIMSANLNKGEPVRVEGLTRVHSSKGQEILQKFDEHSVAKQHKIGVIYQKYGQTTEEEMFCNNNPSQAFKEFLSLLGDNVKLKGFQRYRGGLDNCNNQTGEYSVYTEFKGQEIMFHVSTMLPYDLTDRQQVARKRHIGNDIVLIVFQDENTPYSPDCVRSRFLHAHIVVQAEQQNNEETVYKVAVAAKEDVPSFSPPLPTPAVFAKGIDFREWLLTKVLNAEAKCHEASAFLKLSTRTRSQLFNHLFKELSGSTEDIDVGQLDNRKSVATDMLSRGQIRHSPRQRRKTLSDIFSTRHKISTATSPMKSKSNLHPSNEISGTHSSLTTSTPDLTVIGEESAGPSSDRTVSMDRHQQYLVGHGKSSNKKRFRLRGRGKKSERSLTAEIKITEDPYHLDPRYNHMSGYSSEGTSLSSSLNWSVPNDLPGIVRQGQPSISSANPTSLENLTFSLDTSDTAMTHRCASNPDITDNGRRLVTYTPISDIHRSPGSAGPQTFDVAIQFESRRQVFTFPTPPHSVSPTLPLEYGPSHVVTSSAGSRKYSNRVRLLPSTAYETQHDFLASYHSSSSSLDNRHSGGSFPFVPEEDERDDDDKQEGTSTEVEKIDEQQYESGSSVSLEEDITGDGTYDSLLNSLQALTSEVARLRDQQLHLYRENTKLNTKVRKWKAKYKFAKSQLAQQQQQQQQQQHVDNVSSQERKSSEIGTTL